MTTESEAARDELLDTLANQVWALEEILPRHPDRHLKAAFEGIIGAYRRYTLLLSERPLADQARELYHSANGDRWYLACDFAAGAFIRHEANRVSGGKMSNIEIGTFLSQPGKGPEKQELLRLIGTLVTESSKA